MALTRPIRLACQRHPRYEGTRRKKDMNCLGCVALHVLVTSGVVILSAELNACLVVVNDA